MDVGKYSREVQLLIGEIQKNRGRVPQKVLEACDQLEEIGTGLNDDALIGYAAFSRGETYYLLNDANNFYAQMIACLGPMEHEQEWGYLAVANNMLGIVSLNRGNAPFALDYYIKAIGICEEYSLPDIEWMIHLNLGSLYLNIEEYQKSINHTEIAYRYIMDHKNTDGYVQNLTAALLGMGRAYIKLEMESQVFQTEKQLKSECMPFLNDMEKVVIYCFFARTCQFIGEEEARNYWIEKVNESLYSGLPILDVFDDFYDYLEMLLNTEKYDDFFKAYDILDELTKRTTIKNLEKKLLTLKIRYFRRVGQIEEYKLSSVLYFELSEYMERENRLMVSNMIVMRNSYMELTQINKRVAQENTYLQKRSETDPLTGMYNRLKLNEYSEKAFEKAKVNRTAIAVEILDIDYFKQYNDNYGHQAGDDCIKFIASALIEMAKDENVFTARYGGDEFVIIYEGMDMDKIQELATNLRDKIYEKNYEHMFSLSDSRVTISQGACYGTPSGDDSMFTYLQKADEMLYEVKKESRNNFKISEF
ncbi:MAG: GGDEF domain-containing protein [Pseudobutyrivibrio sp.]|nr:GGDEF domain-containing protein [Pseudobutyrivibrio sp.]